MRKYNIIYSTLLIMLSIIQQITGMDQPKLPSRTVSKKWLQLQEEQSSMKAHKEQTPPAQTVTRTLSQKFTKPELEPIQGINEDWTPAQKTYFLQLLSWTEPSKLDKFKKTLEALQQKLPTLQPFVGGKPIPKFTYSRQEVPADASPEFKSLISSAEEKLSLTKINNFDIRLKKTNDKITQTIEDLSKISSTPKDQKAIQQLITPNIALQLQTLSAKKDEAAVLKNLGSKKYPEVIENLKTNAKTVQPFANYLPENSPLLQSIESFVNELEEKESIANPAQEPDLLTKQAQAPEQTTKRSQQQEEILVAEEAQLPKQSETTEPQQTKELTLPKEKTIIPKPLKKPLADVAGKTGNQSDTEIFPAQQKSTLPKTSEQKVEQATEGAPVIVPAPQQHQTVSPQVFPLPTAQKTPPTIDQGSPETSPFRPAQETMKPETKASQYGHTDPTKRAPRQPQSWLDMAWQGITGFFSWAYKAVRSLLFG